MCLCVGMFVGVFLSSYGRTFFLMFVCVCVNVYACVFVFVFVCVSVLWCIGRGNVVHPFSHL